MGFHSTPGLLIAWLVSLMGPSELYLVTHMAAYMITQPIHIIHTNAPNSKAIHTKYGSVGYKSAKTYTNCGVVMQSSETAQWQMLLDG